MISLLKITLTALATSFASVLFSKSMIQWAILTAGEALVKKTSTKYDNIFFAKFKKILAEGEK